MLNKVLSIEQEEILARERVAMQALQFALNRLDFDPDDQKILARSIRQLDDLFLLVIVGEFNSGKSAFINALLGEKLLVEGVTPTTARIHQLRHGPPAKELAEPALEIITSQSPLLNDISIVDTPGTNAINREHEAITQEFVPRADLVLFVTSADRPFTESERAFLERLRDWGKKIVIVINKIDILETPEDVQRVSEFVATSAQTLLGFQPDIFTVSARQALRSKLKSSHARQLEAPVINNRFNELEDYIRNKLDEKERIRLKLLSPLGVGVRLAERYLTTVEGHLSLLKDDLNTLHDIDSQLNVYQKDMQREFHFRLSDIENILHEFENRGVEFFDDRMRVARIVDLLHKSRLKADFEKNVVSDVSERIEKRVHDVIDWMVTSQFQQWRDVTEHLNRRRTRHSERIVGEVGRAFQYDRNRLIETVGRDAQVAVESYNKQNESSRMAESVQMAVAGAALVEVGAVGLGAIVTIIATTTLADVTGLLAAGAVAVIGFFVIPARRREAKRELREKIADMQDRLMKALSDQFDRELSLNLKGINEAIGPYSRFVRAEQERFSTAQTELSAILNDLKLLKARLEPAR